MPRPSIPPGERGAIRASRSTKRGPYRVTVRYREPLDLDPAAEEGEPRRFKTEARSAREAEALAVERWDQVQAEWVTRRTRATQRFTLDGVADAWLASLATKDRAPGTIRTYSRTWRTVLSPVLGEHDVNEVTRAFLLDALDHLWRREPGRSREDGTWEPGDYRLDEHGRRVRVTGEQPRQVLRMVLTYAADRGLRRDERNPLDGADRPDRIPPEPRAMTASEWEALRSLAWEWGTRRGTRSTTDLHDLLVILRYTGCRMGEALGITRDRLDLDGEVPTVLIDRQLLETTGALGPLKDTRRTKKGQREGRLIALHPEAVAVIRRRLATQEERGWTGPDVPLFAAMRQGTHGRGWSWPSHANLRTRLRTLTAGTDLAWVHSHVMRHTLATEAAEKTGSTADAAALLGHADERVTVRSYIERRQVTVLDPRGLFEE